MAEIDGVHGVAAAVAVATGKNAVTHEVEVEVIAENEMVAVVDGLTVVVTREVVVPSLTVMVNR